MELKVWVDGIQRVVCGITEQTTVQEVVIALAQATGRTGRYTLVERWRTMEKMLPPSEHPLQVLAKWGEHAGDVQFVLRRTGASSVIGEGEGIVTPERTTYRQSLPPQLKHRQKNEAILNRKEPKRKSLTITGLSNDVGVSKYRASIADGKNEPDADKSGNKMQSPQKKALIPPAFRNLEVAPQKLQTPKAATSPKKNKKEALIPPAFRSDAPPSSNKKALIPPHLRGDSSDGPTVLQAATGNINVSHEHRTSNSSDASSPKQKRQFDMTTHKPSQSKSESAKARAEFTRLVLEQHEHVNEQSLTLKSLDDEMEKYQATMQRREKNAAILKKEIENLEKTVQDNEADLYNEPIIENMYKEEDNKGHTIQGETSKFQSEVNSVNLNIKELEKHLLFLQEEIEQEKKLQQRKHHEDTINRKSAVSERKKLNNKIRNITSEMKNVEDSIDRSEAVVYEKNLQLEILNRELRQVNLQQFIRQTGSKVTVLPPDADRNMPDRDFPTTSMNYDNMADSPAIPPSGGGDSGGVWV